MSNRTPHFVPHVVPVAVSIPVHCMFRQMKKAMLQGWIAPVHDPVSLTVAILIGRHRGVALTAQGHDRQHVVRTAGDHVPVPVRRTPNGVIRPAVTVIVCRHRHISRVTPLACRPDTRRARDHMPVALRGTPHRDVGLSVTVIVRRNRHITWVTPLARTDPAPLRSRSRASCDPRGATPRCRPCRHRHSPPAPAHHPDHPTWPAPTDTRRARDHIPAAVRGTPDRADRPLPSPS